MRVVAIGAHPDDIEIGAGGAIALHMQNGDSVTFLVLTRGSELTEAQQRKREATQAASILGVEDVRFLDFTDTRVPYSADVVQRIEEHINEIEPDRIYVHSEEDTHQDHRKSALSSIAATRKFDGVFAYESPSTRASFTPEHYITFDEETLERKIEAIRAHESQKEKKYLEAEAMGGLARFRGRQANAKYAESFQTIRMVERHDTETSSYF